MADNSPWRDALSDGPGEKPLQVSAKGILRATLRGCGFEPWQNARPTATLQIEPTFTGEDAICVSHRVVMNVEIDSKLANGGKRRSRGKLPGYQKGANLCDDLLVRGDAGSEIDLENGCIFHCRMYMYNVHNELLACQSFFSTRCAAFCARGALQAGSDERNFPLNGAAIPDRISG